MSKNLNVVIAENDVNAERTINRSLQVHKDWHLFKALDEEDVLELAHNEQIDAIVLESLFPGRALNILYKLQSSPKTAHIPIMAVTGNMGPQARELLLGGATQCIAQPVGGRSLTVALRRMVQEAKPSGRVLKQAINDPERISALEETDMLDYIPSKEFSNLTRLAAKILGVPVALASLVDKDRQYFLCQHGLVEPWASQRETPLSHSFCQWVVASKKPLVVDDARKHTLLAQNKAVKNLGVIAYAGQPITADDDQLIGSFCAIDAHPRSWTFDDLATLNDLAKLTETYVVFEKELLSSKRTVSQDTPLTDADKLSAIRAAEKGVKAITRLLGRKGLPLDSSERQFLAGTMETLSKKQLELSSR